MSIPIDRLSYQVDRIQVVSPCLWLEIFLEYAEGPEILDFYQKARDLLGDGLKHYDPGSGRRKPISARSETLVQTWCDNPSYAPNKQYFLLMCGGEEGATASELILEFWPRRAGTELPVRGAYPYSGVACAVPLDHPLVLEGGVINWIKGLKILSDGYFISGSCGIGLNFPINFPTLDASDEGKAHVASALRRHPGLDISSRMIGVKFGQLQLAQQPGDALSTRQTFLKRVNWLSFINEKQVDLLCERGPFEEQIRDIEGVTLHDVPHGLIIQAGESPQIGDSSQGDFVPVYQAVARLLRPIRLQSVTGGDLSYQLQDDGAADWLAAFDTKR